MANRRDFLKGSLATVSLLALGKSGEVRASTPYAGVIYTKDNPGKWAKKVGSHLPSVKVEGSKVTLATRHPMSEQHYIVRHTLVLSDGTVVGEKTFYPSDKKAVSEFSLPAGYSGKIYATSFCNLHDFWVNETTV